MMSRLKKSILKNNAFQLTDLKALITSPSISTAPSFSSGRNRLLGVRKIQSHKKIYLCIRELAFRLHSHGQ